MESLTIEQIGFWGLLIVTVIKDGLIPAFAKIIPAKIQVTEREQNRIDRQQEFEHKIELRHVEAIEGIKEVLLAINERLNVDERLLLTISERLNSMDEHLKIKKVNKKPLAKI